jgi:hypothetical protein
MKSRSRSMIVAALAAMISTSPAQAGGLKQVAEISIPGDPITDIGIMAIAEAIRILGIRPGYLYGPTKFTLYSYAAATGRFFIAVRNKDRKGV